MEEKNKNKNKTPNSKKPNLKPNMPGAGKEGGPKINWFFVIMLVMISLFFLPKLLNLDGLKEITTEEFYEKLEKGDISKIYIYNEEHRIEAFTSKELKQKTQVSTKKDDEIGFFQPEETPTFEVVFGDQELFEKKIGEIQQNLISKNKEVFEYEFKRASIWDSLLPTLLLYAAIFFFLWFFLFRRIGAGGGPGGQIFNIGKSRAKLFDENSNVKTTFENVAGLEGAKEEVQEVVDFLKNPDKYTKLGGKIPKGVLLIGPPGTGKTLLAKAVAGEAKVPFFSLSGSDFVEMFVGVGASRVRDLFNQAKTKSPSIIFIDEIDAIGRARGRGNFTGANDERENTLNQLLTEMDGFGTNTNVIVMAATNRADVLDKALLRPGRFDRSISVDLPEINERKEIFNVHLKNIKTDTELDVDFLAHQTPGFSGADIANICNEAALIAARKGKSVVEKQDFLDAVDRIIGGLEKKGKIIKPSERKRIAFHEAGHATVSWMLEHAAPLVKVTIVPRGRSLGAAWYLPEERQITTEEQMLDELCSLLGGRAAEEVMLGDYSTGAQNDLERAYKQTNAMVTIFGLSKEIGHISYYDSSGQSEYSFNKPFSEKTAEKIDLEIKRIIDDQYKRAVSILTENKDKLQKLSEKLLEDEVIFKEDLEEIFGKRYFQEVKEAESVSSPIDDEITESSSND